MNVRKESKDYLWVIPLVAGLLVIIAILAPTAHFGYGGVTWDWWMWGLTTMGVVGYDSVSLFISEVDIIIPSIITTCVILLSVVNLFILSIKTRKKRLNTKKFELMSILSGVLSIGIMIYYIIAMDTAFYDGLTIEGTVFPAGYHFWTVFDAGFGTILPFISAILSFIGVGVFRYYLKHDSRFDISQPKMSTAREYVPISKPMGHLNFCPECGKEILQAGAHFCINCGFKF